MTLRTLTRLAALSLAALPALGAPSPAHAQADGREAATAAAMERLKGSPPRLYAFLREMPKGADLHMHLSGAVYAESFLRWAAEDSLCVSRRALAIVWPQGSCAGGDTISAATAQRSALRDSLIDAWSMRNWDAARDVSGHDQFFATFARFGATDRRIGDELAEVVSRAASGRVGYVELMATLDGRVASS